MDAGVDAGVDVSCEPDAQAVGVTVNVGVASSSIASSGVQAARPKDTPSVNKESNSLYFPMMKASSSPLGMRNTKATYD